MPDKEKIKPDMQSESRKMCPMDSQQQIKFNRNFLLLMLVIASAAFFWVVRIFIISIIVAATFTILFYPIYKWLLKKLRNHATLASLLTCVMFLLVLLIPSFIVGDIVINQSVTLFQSAQKWLTNFVESCGAEQ